MNNNGLGRLSFPGAATKILLLPSHNKLQSIMVEEGVDAKIKLTHTFYDFTEP